MIERGFTESVDGDTTLAWLGSLSYSIANGSVIALGDLDTLRDTVVSKLISGELRVKRVKRTAATI